MSRPATTKSEPGRRFVVLFEGRAGSTHLTGLLNSHPRVAAFGDGLWACKAGGGGSPEQLDWTRRTLTQHDPEHHAIGFKTKYRDILDKRAFASLVAELRPVIVHLERRNLVKSALSTMNAQRLFAASGTHNLVDPNGHLPPPKVDVGELEELLAEEERYRDELRGYVQQLACLTHRITYEELLDDEAAVVSAMQARLGVAPEPRVSSNVLKSTPDDLQKAVANFDEVRDGLAGTRYEPMVKVGDAALIQTGSQSRFRPQSR